MHTDDVVAIEQVLYRYCFALDKGTADEVASLFHESATLLLLYEESPPVKGRAAIREWYANYHKTYRNSVNHQRHCVTNPSVEVFGDRATVQACWTEDFVYKATGKPIWLTGHYQDTMVKEGGRWLFMERQIHMHYASTSSIDWPQR